MSRISLFLTAVLFSINSFSQTFENILPAQNINYNANLGSSGNPASLFDFNQDGWDDLTIGNYGSFSIFQNNSGSLQQVATFNLPWDIKSILWVDYNNDDQMDLFITFLWRAPLLFEVSDSFVLTDRSSILNIPAQSEYHSWGASWADIDNNGWLDLFVCNYGVYGQVNWMFMNNQGVNFSLVQNEAVQPALQSLQSAFIDLNHDLLPDLYISNDREDGNEFYQNLGSGQFSDLSQSSGLNISLDAMSNSFCDFDHDGDFDVFVANNQEGNHFMINENNVFNNMATELGVAVYSSCWGSLWIDYDNDTWQDLFVCTAAPINNQFGIFFENNNGILTEINPTGISRDFPNHVNAKGDLNNDGYYDYFVQNAGLFPYKYYLNEGGTNHYVKFTLEGTFSNPQGIGSYYEVWSGGTRQIGYSQLGENYLGQNSQHLIYGIGENTNVDSIIVKWPSGLVDHFLNIPSDSTLTLTEGASLIPSIASSQPSICNGIPVQLQAQNMTLVTWSNFAFGTTTTVFSPGNYTASGFNIFGEYVSVSYSLALSQNPNIIPGSALPLCAGNNDGLIAFVDFPLNYVLIWNNTDTVTGPTTFENLAAQTYNYQWIDPYGCSWNHEIELIDPEPLEVSLEIQNVTCFAGNDGTAVLELTGGTGTYVPIDWEGLNPSALPEGNYTVNVSDSNGCNETVSFSIEQPTEITLSISPLLFCANQSTQLEWNLNGGQEPYFIEWNNLNVNNPNPGDYTIHVVDNAGCEISFPFTVDHYPVLSYDIYVEPSGDSGSGFAEVLLNNTTEPVNILWSTSSTDFSISNLFPGMYNVQIIDQYGCTYEETIEIIYLSLAEYDSSSWNIWNTSEGFRVETSATIDELHIFDLQGKWLKSFSNIQNNEVIPTVDLSPGIYLLTDGKKFHRIFK